MIQSIVYEFHYIHLVSSTTNLFCRYKNIFRQSGTDIETDKQTDRPTEIKFGEHFKVTLTKLFLDEDLSKIILSANRNIFFPPYQMYSRYQTDICYPLNHWKNLHFLHYSDFTVNLL